MHLTTSAAVVILGFSASALANIFPDPDPCNPYPPLQGEYRGEFDIRMDLDARRCACQVVGPQPSETRQEFNERNRVDALYCRTFAPPIWFAPPAIITLGPIITPLPFGFIGPTWREGPSHWYDTRWGRPSPPPASWHGPRGGPGPGRSPYSHSPGGRPSGPVGGGHGGQGGLGGLGGGNHAGNAPKPVGGAGGLGGLGGLGGGNHAGNAPKPAGGLGGLGGGNHAGSAPKPAGGLGGLGGGNHGGSAPKAAAPALGGKGGAHVGGGRGKGF